MVRVLPIYYQDRAQLGLENHLHMECTEECITGREPALILYHDRACNDLYITRISQDGSVSGST